MQGQCTEVVEFEPELSSQCLRAMENEGTSSQLYQPPREQREETCLNGFKALQGYMAGYE